MEKKTWAKVPVLALLLQIIAPVFAVNAQVHAKNCAKQCREIGYNLVSWSTFSAADYFQKYNWSPALLSYDM
jgi:hypothetical protein